MKPFFLVTLWASCLTSLIGATVTPGHRRAILNSLDPHSISQHLAYYELYAPTQEGMTALSKAWQLLNQGGISRAISPNALPFDPFCLQGIICLVNKQANAPTPQLTENQLLEIEKLASFLPNRFLRGKYANSEAEVLALHPEEIDLARGLFLSNSDNSFEQMRAYEAMMDLMALQILARVPLNAPPEKKIRAINDFVFHEMGFRFPPHSIYAKDIDVYTFLPSILDSRKGVCLGVSILYLCLAQRLNLTLEMITPPGHIYVRYRDKEKEINIETTARGIHVDSVHYLGMATRSLQQRTIKEVIGMAHFNQASTFWHRKEFKQAIECYRIAERYLPGDPLVKELLAYNLLFDGQVEEGKRLLEEVKDYVPDHAIVKDKVAEDFLAGRVDPEGILAVYSPVDETRDSIWKKKEELEGVVKAYPHFRAGLMALAVTWIQLHRAGEALEWLERYHAIEPEDPTAEYYLAALYAERRDFVRAWTHLKASEELVARRNHFPKPLESFRRELSAQFPEP